MFTRGARLPSSVSALARGRRRARCTLAEASRFDSLFATPLWRANLNQTGALDARDARALVASVRRAFRSSGVDALSEGLLRRYAAQGPDALAGAANNEFFQHQIDTLTSVGPDGDGELMVPASLATCAPLVSLGATFRTAARLFVQQCYAVPEPDARALLGGRRIVAWASVHASGSSQ